jgi:glycosyltransferase involved in cell wall biosynthesis
MHIIFVINSLENRGGTERAATLLANHLSCHYDITILSKSFSHQKNAYQLGMNVSDIKFTGSNFIFTNKCKNYIAQNKPDIVVVHTMSKLTPVLLINGIKAKNIWSLEHISFDFHNTLFKYFRRKLYKKLDKVITLTHEDARNYAFIADKVSVIANSHPLPIRKSVDSLDSKTIVSIGRLTSQKGYDLLIQAWSLIEIRYPKWSLHIYGEGEDKEKLEVLINCLNLRNIILEGITTNVQTVYDTAEFYVMSSRYEGLPVVLIEAQSRGLPVVSFDCPSGPAEIISDNIDGYLVENGNTDMLADRISDLIENEALRRKFSNEALLSAKRFEPEKIISQWMNLIETVVSK